jgi:integrase
MINDAVKAYLAIRRAAGYKLQDDAVYLGSFAQFATERGDTHVVSHSAIAWAKATRSESQRATRLRAVIRLARFSHAADPRHEIPPEGVFCVHRRRPIPYLYTDAETKALMAATCELGPEGSFRPLMYRTLIGLLAATGLRISEALALRAGDLTNDGLLIRHSKFGKSRLVVLHETTRLALQAYHCERAKLAAFDDYLFVSTRKRRMRRQTVYPTFLRLLQAAGLPREGRQRRPRLMDFRHSFASTVLAAGPDRRDRVGRHTLALTTYLGHASPASTFWYLQSSPALMDDIVAVCERFLEEKIP